MHFQLFEFLEQFKTGAFSIRWTQLEKTGPIDKAFIPLEILIKFHFQSFTVFCAISTFIFGEGYLSHFQQISFNWTQSCIYT